MSLKGRQFNECGFHAVQHTQSAYAAQGVTMIFWGILEATEGPQVALCGRSQDFPDCHDNKL
jgi:hypothetical protein